MTRGAAIGVNVTLGGRMQDEMHRPIRRHVHPDCLAVVEISAEYRLLPCGFDGPPGDVSPLRVLSHKARTSVSWGQRSSKLFKLLFRCAAIARQNNEACQHHDRKISVTHGTSPDMFKARSTADPCATRWLRQLGDTSQRVRGTFEFEGDFLAHRVVAYFGQRMLRLRPPRARVQTTQA